MGHHHDRKTLEAIHAHPMSMNLNWVDVERLLTSLGATMEVAHHGREVKVRLNGIDRTLHIPHGTTIESKDQMADLRHFFDEAGVDANSLP
jgi:hypothetical protein